MPEKYRANRSWSTFIFIKAEQNNIDKQGANFIKGYFERTVHAIESNKKNREHLITCEPSNP